MLLKLFLIISITFVSFNSFADSSKYIFSPNSSCPLFESKAGKWVKVDSSELSDSVFTVSTKPTQPNYFYVRKNGSWFMADKSCFVKSNRTASIENNSTNNSKKSSFAKFFHLSILSWNETIGIKSSTANAEYSINASQYGAMLGMSIPLITSNIDFLLSPGILLAVGSTSSNSSSIIYNTTGNYIYGLLLALNAELKPKDYFGFYYTADPFIMYRTGDWVAPTSTISTRTYSVVDKSAIRFGTQVGIKKFFTKSIYLKPQLGVITQSDIGLIWSIQLGVAF